MTPSIDAFARPFAGAPHVLALDASPSRPRRTRDGRTLLRAVRPSAAIRSNYDDKLARLVDEMSNSVEYWLGAAYRSQEDRISVLAGDSYTWPLSDAEPDNRIADPDPSNRDEAPILAMDAPPSEELRLAVARLRRRWFRRFDEASADLARYFAQSVQRRSADELRKILRRAGISVEFKVSQPIRDAVRAIVDENVSLIKSIPRQYLTQVEGSVMRSVLAGRDQASLFRDLREQHGVTKRRAELITLDQTNKATAHIQRLQHLEVGIERAIWRHSHAGKEPRPTHVANDGKEYDVREGWLDPAIGRRIWPGTEINCRCYSVPVMPR